MKITIISIFPEIFSGFLDSSLIGKARSAGKLDIQICDIRKFADPPHFKVDDTPYGGGAGMVLKPEPLTRAIEAAKSELPSANVTLLSAAGTPFNQSMARDFSGAAELILVCGRYEGVDQRVIDLLVDREISIGDYVLMGGEVAAMAIVEATARLIPDILGNDQSVCEESFSSGIEHLLEGPQYTRPAEFRGKKVPEILLSGDHQRIIEWRLAKAREKTAKVRPDLSTQSRS